MNTIIAIQPKWCKRVSWNYPSGAKGFAGTSQVVRTALKRPSENTGVCVCVCVCVGVCVGVCVSVCVCRCVCVGVCVCVCVCVCRCVCVSVCDVYMCIYVGSSWCHSQKRKCDRRNGTSYGATADVCPHLQTRLALFSMYDLFIQL